MKTKINFTGVFTLRQKVKTNNDQLKVLHPHEEWLASFTWSDPASLQSIDELERKLGKTLPADYVHFLTTVSNGAILYYEVKNGQWGYRIYGTGDISEGQTKWEQVFEDTWMPNFLAVGKVIGESHALVMDLNKPTKDGSSCEILDGNPLDVRSDWYKMSRSFHDWLDNLITAQGAKYWLWV